MRAWLPVLLVVMSYCIPAIAQDDEAQVLFSADFEVDLCGFVTMDTEAELARVEEAENIHGGTAALEMWYFQRAVEPENMDQGIPGALAMPLTATYPELRAVSFALRSALSTPIGVSLMEGDDGPRYTGLVYSNQGDWQQYTLGLDDFQFDINGPEDPDGRLTPENISAVAFIDMGGFFRKMTEESGMFYVPDPGEQTLWLDDLEFLSKAPAAPDLEEGIVPLIDYKLPLMGAVIAGGDEVSLQVDGEPDADRPVKADYVIPEQTLFAMIHSVPPGKLVGIESLRLRLKVAKPTTLIVNLEEQGKPGDENKAAYNTTISLQPSEDLQDQTIPIAAFVLGEEHFDANGRLDLEHVRMIMIADVSAIMGQAQLEQTLWLDSLVGIRAK